MTPTRRLLDLNLDGRLDDFVTSRRLTGQSWAAISLDLHTVTGTRVSDETLRNWYAEAQP